MKPSLTILAPFVVLCTYLTGTWSSSSCTVRTSDKEFDLSYFSTLNIDNTVQDNSSALFTYQWRVCNNCSSTCTNSITGNEESGNVYLTESSLCNSVLSKWIASDIEASDYKKDGVTGLTVTLRNGDSCGASSKMGTNFHFLCGQTSLDDVSAKQDPSDTCLYNFVIKTSEVCNPKSIKSNNGSSEDTVIGLSYGWLIIIVGFTSFILIFGIGYVVKSKKNGSWKCSDSFPCYKFCCALPVYTWTGCKVSYEFASEKIRTKILKKKPKMNDDGLLDDEEDDITNIANAEDTAGDDTLLDDPELVDAAR